jgi:hypothetical protein
MSRDTQERVEVVPMAYSVTIKTGLVDVVLPNGNRYQAGDVVVLSDGQFGQIPASTKTAVFSASSIVAVPNS